MRIVRFAHTNSTKSAQSGTITYLIMKQIQAIYREEGKLKELSSEAKPYLDKLLPWSADLPETIRKPKKA